MPNDPDPEDDLLEQILRGGVIVQLVGVKCLHCERIFCVKRDDLLLLTTCPFCVRPLETSEGSEMVQ